MRRLPWWMCGVGLLFLVAGIANLLWPNPMSSPMLGTVDGVVTGRLLEVLLYLRSVGFVVFLGGTFLLAATVIADAITKSKS